MPQQTRPKRLRSGIALLVIGAAAGIGAWSATALHFEVVANFLAACVAGCFVLCVPLLLGPTRIAFGGGVNSGIMEVGETCRVYGAGAYDSEVTSADVGAETDAGEGQADFVGGAFDIGFDASFFEF